MQYVTRKPSLARRFVGAAALTFLTALLLSGSASAVYYNLGMFWKTQTTVATFTERRIAEGDSHSCAVVSDGTVKCWGLNTDGQLGDGTTTQRTTPVAVSGLTGVVSIALGVGHSCTVLSDGTVKCWGKNDHGQLGDGTTTQRNTPVAVSGLSGAVSLALGSGHSCVVLSDGSAKCWGWNADGQIGDGTNTERTTPVAVTGLSGAVLMTAGRYAHTCALLSDGTARCWGMGAWGQLGNNTTSNSWTPAVVSGITGAISITGGIRHNCVQLSDGSAKCWGYNDVGQLGDGTTTNRLTAVAVSGLSGAVSISCGGWGSSCAALSDGTAKCWGLNTSGQLGDGSLTSSSTPVTVSGLSSVVSTALGTAHSCAVLSDGTEKCWGSNANGQLGNGTTTNSSTSVSVSGSTTGPFTNTLERVTGLSGGGTHSCALVSDGTARCWGYNLYGQLGNGSTSDNPIPVTVSGLSGAVSISSGSDHSCAVLSNGTARCWGRGTYGQLGNAATTDSSTPVTVSGLSGAVSIAAGSMHSCALLSDGTARCWGNDVTGALGNGAGGGIQSTPVTVSGLTGAISIFASVWSCAVLSDGTAKCWGANTYNELGDGTTTERPSPVLVSGLSSVVSLAGGGFNHNCAVLSDGTAKCWGYNASGQLGDGTNTQRATPVAVSGLSGAVSIATKGNQTCAALSNGTAKCWGLNSNGQLGDGTITSSPIPVMVSGLSDAASTTVGSYQGCAMLSQGTVKCWGKNTNGQLGDGSFNTSSVPVPVSTTKVTDLVSSASANNGTGIASLVITKPANTLTDRVMIAVITVRVSTTTITTPSGWTLLESQATGNIRQSLYYRVATSADTSATDYTWLLSASVKASGVIGLFVNVDPVSPILSSNGLATTGSATITAPSLTTTENSFHAVAVYGIASDNPIINSGYPLATENASTGNGAVSRTRTQLTHQRYTTSGATGVITATDSGGTDDNVGQHVLLKTAP